MRGCNAPMERPERGPRGCGCQPKPKKKHRGRPSPIGMALKLFRAFPGRR